MCNICAYKNKQIYKFYSPMAVFQMTWQICLLLLYALYSSIRILIYKYCILTPIGLCSKNQNYCKLCEIIAEVIVSCILLLTFA